MMLMEIWLEFIQINSNSSSYKINTSTRVTEELDASAVETLTSITSTYRKLHSGSLSST